jgi:hypothetical protein
MKTILRILQMAGESGPRLHLEIFNPPYLPLTIEALPESGPLGLPCIRVAHSSRYAGSQVVHPEMRFEYDSSAEARICLNPYYLRNDYVRLAESSRVLQDGSELLQPRLHQRHIRFALEWDEVLTIQGTTEAFGRMQALLNLKIGRH